MGQTVLFFPHESQSAYFSSPKQQNEYSFNFQSRFLASQCHFRLAVCKGLNRSVFGVLQRVFRNSVPDRHVLITSCCIWLMFVVWWRSIPGLSCFFPIFSEFLFTFLPRPFSTKLFRKIFPIVFLRKNTLLLRRLHTTNRKWPWLTKAWLWNLKLCSFCGWGWKTLRADVHGGKRQSLTPFHGLEKSP